MTLGEVGVCGVGVGFIVGHGLENQGKNILIHEAGATAKTAVKTQQKSKKNTHNNQQHHSMTLGEVGLCGGGVGFVVGHGLENRGKNILIHEAGGSAMAKKAVKTQQK